jgi:16S rRNA (uracil1498-N3)-methyltransferase
VFVDEPLAGASSLELGDDQSSYVLKVMRLSPGDELLVFNGRDGEHVARIAEASRRHCRIEVIRQARPQTSGLDIDYLFAPLKRARLDYMVQKAAELGVRRLRPVLTEHTQVERINLDRMRANVIEAAEQCGVLWIAEVLEPAPLADLLAGWDAGRRLIYADEDAPLSSPIAGLSTLAPGPVAVLVGPEGGFSPAERKQLRSLDFVRPISLGPRVMRADTAAVAALTLVNAVLGDWR